MANDSIKFAEDIATLKADFRSLKEEVDECREESKELRERLSYYDRMAVKAGGILIGAIAIGAMASMGFSKLRDKLIEWFLS